MIAAGNCDLLAAENRNSSTARSIKRAAHALFTMGSMESVSRDRLRELVDLMLASLDDRADGRAIAARAHVSRFHFDHLIAAGLREAPGAFRHRLLLERAAWQLTRSVSVTEAGLHAGYGSTEAFTRAFSRAFGGPPSRFARTPRDFRIGAPNGVHFHPPAGLVVSAERRSEAMDATERLLEHDRWLTGRLLERASTLTEEQLDRKIRPGHVVLSFDGPEATVRQMLDRLVWTKEVWLAAIEGRDFPEAQERSLPALEHRFAAAADAFIAAAARIREDRAWDDTFVDALCEPPQSFTFGGVIAHVITYSAYRREVLIRALADLGVPDIEPGCPMEWDRLRQSERPRPAHVLRGTAA
jgi:AraC family transcriptional regulator